MEEQMRLLLIALAMLGVTTVLADDPVKDKGLLRAVMLYASFDDKVEADVAGGERSVSTRGPHPTEKGKFTITRGYPEKAFRIAKGKGIQGGALECVDVLPSNGRIFFPARGNIAFKKGGWGGAVMMWIKTDPDKLLKTRFCDPVQITQKGAGDGGIWFDFNDKKPRDLRMGVFPAIPDGTKGMGESDPNAPMVRVPKVGFKADDWHHVVLSWRNFDTGKKDALATLWIDGKRIGQVKDRELAMRWDLDRAGIYIAVNYIGLLDEFAVFNRELGEAEVQMLHRKPGALAALKKRTR
jgi:hypothetical protein